MQTFSFFSFSAYYLNGSGSLHHDLFVKLSNNHDTNTTWKNTEIRVKIFQKNEIYLAFHCSKQQN